MDVFKNKTVLVGVCGGISAYKVCGLVSRLVQSGADVHVMMTHNATEFVTPLTFETLSHNRVTVDTFDRDFTWEVEHVTLAKKADLCVIAPATANVIAKIACGIADDFLTTTVLALKCPMLIAPAMNTAMLQNPATQNNLNTLSARGAEFVYGGVGHLACGDNGSGRMAEADGIFNEIVSMLSVKRDLVGKTVLVTSGATRADIDPVRFLSNRSSGKMGYAVAAAAYARGANVIYIKGYTDDFVLPNEWSVVDAFTTQQLLDAVKSNLGKADISVMAAAPCDYIAESAASKIKSATLELNLRKAPDCAAWAGKHKGASKLIIFAAETDNGEKHALQKLNAKNADLAVLNDVTQKGAGFDVDTNIVTLITSDGAERLPLMQKRELADVILDKILSL